MIRTTRGTLSRSTLARAIGGAILLLGPGPLALAQTGTPAAKRDLPDSPLLAPPPAGPSLGPTPGALEPSAFSPGDPQIIGGRARGGAGRVPLKTTRTRTSSSGAPSGGGGPLSLPPALPDLDPADAAESSAPLAAIEDDPGPPDGLTLNAALARMMAANLALLALKYEVPQAEADILTAGLRANPLIYADAQLIPYGPYTSSRPVGPTEYDISITHPLDVSGKRKARVAVARAAKSTVEAQLQDAARRQVGILCRAFVDLQAARLDALTAESAVGQQERAVARGKPGPTLDRLRDQLEKARDVLADARESLDDAREAIGLLMNLPAEQAATLQPRGGLRDLAPPPPPVEDLTTLALAHRPDLIAARRGITRAGAEVKSAQAGRFEDVFLFYDPFSYQDNRISKQPSGRSWAIGLTVPLPIYNRNQGNIARARGNRDQTQVELAGLERRVVAEVRQAEREYRASRQSLDRAERTTVPHAREARARAAAEFAAGKLPLDEYLDRLNEDNDAARTYRDALVRHRRSMLELNTTLGVRLLP